MLKINEKLKKYIEDNIFPIYEKNDFGHNLSHIEYVIKRSLNFASMVENVNYDMVYTIAAYHDIGHHIDPKNHEKVSAEILENDENLKQFFSNEQIKVMSEAVYDHRASLEYEPRSVYGKIVSSADRNVIVEMPLIRTYTYRIKNKPESSLDEIVEESRQHCLDKFGKNGYAKEKMYFEDLEYKKFLDGITEIASDEEKFKEKYFELNGINDVKKNMVFLFDELKKHKELSLDQILYYVYIKLNTKKTFSEIKDELLCAKEIDEFEYYTHGVNKELKNYIEQNIFPIYDNNDDGHGIIHIKEVIRRSFALNETFKLQLDPNMIYAIAAWHDFKKYKENELGMEHADIASMEFSNDLKMPEFFDDEELEIIAEAIKTHGHSKDEGEIKTEYGKLISSADRNTTIEMVFIRSFGVAKGEGKNSSRELDIETYLENTWKRLSKRYSLERPENMFYEDDSYKIFLKEMRELLNDPIVFKNYYCEINNINDRSKLVKEYDNQMRRISI